MRLLPVVCGKGLEPGTVRRVMLVASLPLAAAVGDIVEGHSKVAEATSPWVTGHVLMLLLFVFVLFAFAAGLAVGYLTSRTTESRLKAELRAKEREAALQKLTVAELILSDCRAALQEEATGRPRCLRCWSRLPELHPVRPQRLS